MSFKLSIAKKPNLDTFKTWSKCGLKLLSSSPVYIMLNKPPGFVSATKDLKHPTVLGLIQHPQKNELHIVGRLNFNTTGLVLLTYDGVWSRKISLPETRLAKTYEVALSKPSSGEYIVVFQEGIYFGYENITTRPACLEMLSQCTVRLSLIGGKYHQVKPMFGFSRTKCCHFIAFQWGT